MVSGFGTEEGVYTIGFSQDLSPNENCVHPIDVPGPYDPPVIVDGIVANQTAKPMPCITSGTLQGQWFIIHPSTHENVMLSTSKKVDASIYVMETDCVFFDCAGFGRYEYSLYASKSTYHVYVTTAEPGDFQLTISQ